MHKAFLPYGAANQAGALERAEGVAISSDELDLAQDSGWRCKCAERCLENDISDQSRGPPSLVAFTFR